MKSKVALLRISELGDKSNEVDPAQFPLCYQTTQSAG